jgi:chorismate synthase
VAAAAVAEKYLRLAHGIEVVAFVCSVGHVNMEPMEEYTGPENEVAWREKWNKWWETLHLVSRQDVDSNEVRCPDKEFAQKMREVCILFTS